MPSRGGSVPGERDSPAAVVGRRRGLAGDGPAFDRGRYSFDLLARVHFGDDCTAQNLSAVDYTITRKGEPRLME